MEGGVTVTAFSTSQQTSIASLPQREAVARLMVLKSVKDCICVCISLTCAWSLFAT